MTEVLSEKVKERIRCGTDPDGSIWKAEDVAKAAAFLASDGAVILQDR